jgi:tripartite-type tricarboxylate transporter receptor subunit TctC
LRVPAPMPLVQNVSYDPVRDFSPVTMVAISPNALVVHPSLPVTNVKDLIALAKARPGDLNYSSGTTGSSTHLAPELFKSMAGLNIVRIKYRGTAAALSGLAGGEVHMMMAGIGAAAPFVKSGRLRALAVTSAQPSTLAPELPTVAASGLPGYDAVSRFAVFAPAKTPDTIIARLNQEILKLLALTEIREKFFTIGVEAVGGSPEQLAATMKSEMSKMGKAIKDARIRGE